MTYREPHEIGLREGAWWCFTEDVPADLCEDEDRCSHNCVCNFDPDTRDTLEGVGLLTTDTPPGGLRYLVDLKGRGEIL